MQHTKDTLAIGPGLSGHELREFKAADLYMLPIQALSVRLSLQDADFYSLWLDLEGQSLID